MVMAAGTRLEADELTEVNFIRQLFTAARNYRSKRVEWWRKSYQLVHNRAWAASRDPWMPSPSVSETYPIVQAIVGWMTDQRPMLYVNAATDPGGKMYPIASILARDLEKVIEANWANRDTDAEHEKMLWDGLMYGTGILKTVWDCSLEEGLGDAKTVRVDPFAFYPDPQAASLDNCNYLIEANTMSLQELDRRYPGAADAILSATEETTNLDQRPDLYTVGRPPMANPGGLFGNAPRYGMPGGGRERASAGSYYDMGVTVYECWIREHDLWTEERDDGQLDEHVDDRWRVVVVSGNRVLLNEPAEALFGHGRHPYSRFVMSDVGEFWGMSLVEHLAPLQIHLNRLMAAIQNNAELTGNPIFLEDSRSGLQRTKVVARAGGRLTKNPGSEVNWLPPPPMQADVRELIQFYITEMERVSGLGAVVRGAQPEGRPSTGTLDSLQEAAFVRIRLALRNMERVLRTSGQLLASLICENYTQPRIVAITGQENMSPMVLSSRHFYVPDDSGEQMPLKFALWVQAGSSMPTSRQARAAEADVLYAMGGIDRKALLDAHDYPNRDTVLERITKQIATGTWSPPGKRQRSR